MSICLAYPGSTVLLTSSTNLCEVPLYTRLVFPMPATALSSSMTCSCSTAPGWMATAYNSCARSRMVYRNEVICYDQVWGAKHHPAVLCHVTQWVGKTQKRYLCQTGDVLHLSIPFYLCSAMGFQHTKEAAGSLSQGTLDVRH